MGRLDIIVRHVRAADLPAVAEIYDYYVLNAVCTFATEPDDEASWRAWLNARSESYPGIVAEVDGRIVGWGTLSRWNNRCAYRFSAENSVYIRAEMHRRGVGRRLLERLIESARAAGHRNLIAQIADHQTASERLHAALGFREVGCLRNIGFKFDRWIDVVIWQLELPAAD